MRQAKCWRRFVSAMAVFTKLQRELLTEVVLLNRSVAKLVAAWTEAGRRCSTGGIMGQLVAALDQLADYFRDEIASGKLAA
jgi:hypothetical protein